MPVNAHSHVRGCSVESLLHGQMNYSDISRHTQATRDLFAGLFYTLTFKLNFYFGINFVNIILLSEIVNSVNIILFIILKPDDSLNTIRARTAFTCMGP